MNSNYKDEYRLLLSHIREKLDNNYLDKEAKEIFSTYIDIVMKKINNSSTNEEYKQAIYRLKKALYEIKELDHSEADNYIDIKPRNNNQEKLIKKESESLALEIDRLQKSQKATKHKIQRYKRKIISYILSLSILISAPISMYIRVKNTPKEKSYKTYKEIHTTINREHDILKPGYIYINANDILTYKTAYEDKLPYEETIEIKEYSPWITEGTESKRKVVTIRKDAKIIGNTIYENDLPNLVLGYGSLEEYEYKYNVEIPYDEKQYTDKIYEITKLVQDTNDYIEKDLPISNYTNLIIILIIELLFLFCEVEIKEKTMLECLLNAINELSNNKKISKKQKQILNKLTDEYIKINKNKIKKKIKQR